MTVEEIILKLHAAADRSQQAADALRDAIAEFQVAKMELTGLIRELRQLRKAPEPWRALNLN
jgi:hypothetical protein